jgi:hypothetical protein
MGEHNYAQDVRPAYLAIKFVAEFNRRNIIDHVSTLVNDYACTAAIDNMPVRVLISTDRDHSEIRGMSGTTTQRIPHRDITPSDLAELVVGTSSIPRRRHSAGPSCGTAVPPMRVSAGSSRWAPYWSGTHDLRRYRRVKGALAEQIGGRRLLRFFDRLAEFLGEAVVVLTG